jgi:TonB family protein
MPRPRFPRLVLALSCLLAAGAGCASEPAPEAAAPRASHARKARSARTNPLSPEQLRHVMNAKASAMAGCYELSESKSKADGGELTVEFEVAVDGRVSGERVSDSSLSDDALNECVLGIVRKSHFPKATAPTDVTWPVRFRAATQ